MRIDSRARRRPLAALLVLCLALLLSTKAWADGDETPEPSPASAEMLKSMREKGLLSEEEFAELWRRQAKYEEEQREHSSLPGWLQNWTVGGDLRIRLERIDPNGSATDAQNFNPVTQERIGKTDRMRLRFRIGAERMFSYGVRAGFRIATVNQELMGEETSLELLNNQSLATNTTHRSENATFKDIFTLKAIGLDRAYIAWQPPFAPAFELWLGKFQNPFVSPYWPTDFIVFDNDINPEGVALTHSFQFLDGRVWTDAAVGFFVVDEVTAATTDVAGNWAFPDPSTRDSFFLGYQLGLNARPLDWLQTGIRGSYYDFQDISPRLSAAMRDLGNGGDAIDNDPLTQLFTGVTAVPTNSGRIKELAGDLYLKLTPFGPRYTVMPFFQFTTILTASSENKGYAAGLQLGDPYDLVRIVGMWAQLERNSTISIFTDSDLFDGYTNTRGWYVAADRYLTPNLHLRFAWFISSMLRPQCQDPNPFQCDVTALNSGLLDFRKRTLHRQRFQLDFEVIF